MNTLMYVTMMVKFTFTFTFTFSAFSRRFYPKRHTMVYTLIHTPTQSRSGAVRVKHLDTLTLGGAGDPTSNFTVTSKPPLPSKLIRKLRNVSVRRQHLNEYECSSGFTGNRKGVGTPAPPS